MLGLLAQQHTGAVADGDARAAPAGIASVIARVRAAAAAQPVAVPPPRRPVGPPISLRNRDAGDGGFPVQSAQLLRATPSPSVSLPEPFSVVPSVSASMPGPSGSQRTSGQQSQALVASSSSAASAATATDSEISDLDIPSLVDPSVVSAGHAAPADVTVAGAASEQKPRRVWPWLLALGSAAAVGLAVAAGKRGRR